MNAWYLQGLKFVDKLVAADAVERVAIIEAGATLHLNAAMCALKLKQYPQVIARCVLRVADTIRRIFPLHVFLCSCMWSKLIFKRISITTTLFSGGRCHSRLQRVPFSLLSLLVYV
jgi:hypothetical protein